MPGLDYLNEPYDPKEDNYYNSGLKQIAFDAALPWAAKHAATGYSKWISPKPSQVSAYKDLKTMLKQERHMGKYGLNLKMGEYGKVVGGNTFLDARAAVVGSRLKQMNVNKLASTLGRYGKVAAIAGAVVMGWQLGKGLLGLSDTFKDTPEEIANRRRKSLYSGGEEFFDSRAAFTQRQRALQVIHNSQMSTRAAFQEEASFLHY